jgi:hypothetical protein
MKIHTRPATLASSAAWHRPEPAFDVLRVKDERLEIHQAVAWVTMGRCAGEILLFAAFGVPRLA